MDPILAAVLCPFENLCHELPELPPARFWLISLFHGSFLAHIALPGPADLQTERRLAGFQPRHENGWRQSRRLVTCGTSRHAPPGAMLAAK
jgi:hypothetical protein